MEEESLEEKIPSQVLQYLKQVEEREELWQENQNRAFWVYT